MAYDESLAKRIRARLSGRKGVSERSMFGGVAFMLEGHMFVGIAGDSLMARVGPDNYEAALARPGAREMDFTGKPMRGYVFVSAESLKKAPDLKRWIDLCAEFAATLPAKPKSKSKAGPKQKV